MPKNHEKYPFSLLPEADKRVKYTQDDFDKVKKLYAEGMSIHGIARVTGMSRRYVQFTLFPERAKHAKDLYRERRKDGRYYDREEHNKAVADLRKRKREIR